MNSNSIDSMNLKSISTIVMIGMCTAIIAVLSQLSIPLPSGVPITLQTFAIALTGYLLGWKAGTISTLVYLLLGAIGVPVFSNFGAGPSVLLGKTGGFLYGFILMTLLCGLGSRAKGKLRPLSLVVCSILGLGICHVTGIIQFAFLTHMTFGASALLVSVPYLIKDILSVVFAYFISITIRKVAF